MAAAWHFRRSHFSGLRGSTGGGKAAHACALLSKVEVKKLAPWPDVQRWNALMTWEKARTWAAGTMWLRGPACRTMQTVRPEVIALGQALAAKLR